MKRIYFFCCLILLARCKSSSDEQAQNAVDAVKPRHVYDYCYATSSGIFVFTAEDRVGRHLKLDATDVQLSPDGTWLAFTQSDSTGDRMIGLMDLETEKTRILDTACHNCYGPVWSPDEKYLAYNAYTGSEWGVKYVDTAGTHADFIARPQDGHGYYSPSWAPDGKRVIVQDMSAVYFIDMKGTILQTVAFNDIDTNITGSSNMRFLLTSKEDRLIYSSGNKLDTVAAPNSEDTPNYIFSYDMQSKKVTRLTAGKYNCFFPVLRGDTIFCHGWDPQGDPHQMTNLYRLDLDGGNFRLAFKSCSYFSCRTRP